MAISTRRRVCWDACTWIALIHREKIFDEKGIVTEDREAMCKVVLTQATAKSRTVEIATSALSLVEVCKIPELKDSKKTDLASFFEHDYILLVQLDRFSAEKARE